MKNTYRVKPGMRYGAHDEFGPGDLVELTEYEAAGHLDKLELVVEEPKTPELEKPKGKGGKSGKGKAPEPDAQKEPEAGKSEPAKPPEPEKP